MDKIEMMVEKTTKILPTLKLETRTRLMMLAGKVPDRAVIAQAYGEGVFTFMERDVIFYYIDNWKKISLERRLAVLTLIKQYQKDRLRFSLWRWIRSFW